MKPIINSSGFGYIVINNEQIKHHVVVYYDGEVLKNEPVAHDCITITFVEKYLNPDIELVIIGTGVGGVLNVPAEIAPYLKQKGIELIAEKTPRIIKAFNSTAKNTVALIHVTC